MVVLHLHSNFRRSHFISPLSAYGGIAEHQMEVPLPNSRRYHSVFVCPVSKEQATESNPPKMLTCGHVIAEESFVRLLKG